MDDARLLALLAAAIDRGEVLIDLERSLATHVHSPVASEAEGNLLLLAVAAPVAVLWWWRGHMTGLVAAPIAGLVLSLCYGRLLAWRMRRRVLSRDLREIGLWRRLWRFGGVTLRTVRGGPGKSCAAPEESWQRFALALAPGRDGYSAGE